MINIDAFVAEARGKSAELLKIEGFALFVLIIFSVSV